MDSIEAVIAESQKLIALVGLLLVAIGAFFSYGIARGDVHHSVV